VSAEKQGAKVTAEMSVFSEGIIQLGAVFSFGFVGSFHCAAMCGPLAVIGHNQGWGGAAGYHFARIAAYAVLGLAVGFLGEVLVISQLAAAGVEAGLLFGMVCLVYALWELFRALQERFVKTRRQTPEMRMPSQSGVKMDTRDAPNDPRRSFRHAAQKTLLAWGIPKAVVLGTLTALLPCGFLYAGLAQAVALGSPVKSSLGMVVFGLATAPALWSGGKLILNIQRRFPHSHRITLALLLVCMSLAILFRAWPPPEGQSQDAPGTHHHHH
jgi:uncharacterized protein